MNKYLLIAVLWISINLHGQIDKTCNLTFSGQVIDQHDNTSVPFARIQIKELNKSLTTDSLGFFNFEGICAGEYTIVCYTILAANLLG